MLYVDVRVEIRNTAWVAIVWNYPDCMELYPRIVNIELLAVSNEASVEVSLFR